MDLVQIFIDYLENIKHDFFFYSSIATVVGITIGGLMRVLDVVWRMFTNLSGGNVQHYYDMSGNEISYEEYLDIRQELNDASDYSAETLSEFEFDHYDDLSGFEFDENGIPYDDFYEESKVYYEDIQQLDDFYTEYNNLHDDYDYDPDDNEVFY